MKSLLLLLLLFCLQLSSIAVKPNFLMIIIDDLRTALGCYGDPNAFTPNIDRLAAESILFTRAYSQQALCAPSRNSLLTSRRPDSLLLYDVHSYWRSSIGNYTTLPQHLKANSYITKSIGKVFHPGISSNFSDDTPYSWSQVPFHPVTDKYKNAPVCPSSPTEPLINFNNSQLTANLICPVNVMEMPKRNLPDIENLEAAQIFLKNTSNKAPFFLAVGFEKPHIPLKFPKEFLDLHPLEKFKLQHYYWPGNISSAAYNPWNDLRRRHDIQQLNLSFPWQKIPDNFAKKIIQSYYASISYIDFLIGFLLNELTYQNLHKNTIIILTSDHGWSLGEHSLWAKYSNFDVAVRVPLIISIPKRVEPFKVSRKLSNLKKNVKVNHLVELVDLFPTISEFAGVPISLCPHKQNTIPIDNDVHFKTDRIKKNDILCTEGLSFVPIIKAAIKKERIPWKKAAFSQYPRPSLAISKHPNSDQPRLNEIQIMGYTLATKQFRYTAWIPFNNQNVNKTDWSVMIAEELYDHHYDPDEMINQAGNYIYFRTKKKLFNLLKKGWRYALPRT